MPQAVLSVIVPTLDEGAVIEALLQSLASSRAQGHQLIVCDGGSSDDTLARAAPWAETVVGPPGRAVQMNRGAALARGEWLWFVHADSRFDQSAQELATAIAGSSREWGRFDLRLDDPAAVFRVIGSLMNLRSRISGIATGDQAMFVRRSLFERVGGFPEQPLMEDIELSRRLKRRARPDCRREIVVTSARRWRRQGIVRSVLLMWRLRLEYFLGVSPQRLAERYRPCGSPTRES